MRPIDHLSEEQLTSQPWGDFATRVVSERYLHKLPHGQENWSQLAKRVSSNVFGAVYDNRYTENVERLINNRQLMPGGRYLYAAGRALHQTQNCLLFMADDSREGWADHYYKHVMGLSTGAGIGSVYSGIRPKGTPLIRTGGVAGGPVNLALGTNEVGRTIRTGGDRRAALWAGLHWWHEDVMEFITIKNWSADVRAAKAANWDAVAPMDMTNHSVCLDDAFFEAMNGGTASIMDVRRAARAKLGQQGLNVAHDSRSAAEVAQQVYWAVIFQMLATGDPGFSIDVGANAGEWLRNACTEVSSHDDSDICNIGSLNMARFKCLENYRAAVGDGTAFLIAGSVYSDLPYDRVAKVRTKNRRLGLGNLGVHEWLMLRGKSYGPDDELGEWLGEYAKSTAIASGIAHAWNLTPPVKTRAQAPNGCLRKDTLVVTAEGILELGELGDVAGPQWQPLTLDVAQENGETRATAFYVNGQAATKRIRFTSGSEIESTPHHQFRVLRESKYVWVKTEELMAGDTIIVSLNTYNKTHEPPLQMVPKHYHTERFHKLPTEVTPALAWFLGIFFADGSIHTKGIRIACNAKHDDWKEVAARGTDLFGILPTIENNKRNCISVCFNSSTLLRWLYVNNLCKPESLHMEVPAVIRSFSRRSLLGFIEGYFAGDGSMSPDSTRYIDTVSHKYALQLQTMIRALGSDATIREHMSGMGSQMYRISWVKTRRKGVKLETLTLLADLGYPDCCVDFVKSIEEGLAETFDISVPYRNTYIANGYVSHNTIGIAAETTTSIEPLICVANKRRVKKGDQTWAQYVIDPVAQRLINMGVKPHDIETAYSLAESREGIERRVAFQAWFQQFVDHGISSTINIPSWGSADDTVRGGVKTHCPTGVPPESTVTWFGEMLLKYLPKLRGITVYPDGARGGQPITQVSYETARKHAGQIVYEQGDICDITKGGSCGA